MYWNTFHFQTFIFRGIAVGQSSILSAEEIAKEALDAKADVVVVENEDLLKRVLLIQHKLPELKAIVQIKGDPPVSDKRRLNRTHKVTFIVCWYILMFAVVIVVVVIVWFLADPDVCCCYCCCLVSCRSGCLLFLCFEWSFQS